VIRARRQCALAPVADPSTGIRSGALTREGRRGRRDSARGREKPVL